MNNYVEWLSRLGMDDVDSVGGKNASLVRSVPRKNALRNA